MHLLWQEQTGQTPIYKLKRSLLTFRDILFARSGIIAYIPITLVTFFMFCGASWQLFWSATDPARYQCYALTFWFGGDATRLLPHEQCAFLTSFHPQALQMLPTEYPPLTLVIFSLPLLLPIAYYQFAFALLMSLLAMGVYWLLQRFGPRGSAFMFAVYLLMGALALAQMRFDLLPALCTLLCIIAAERRRWTAAYICLALGVLFKIYPILLLPTLFIAEQRDLGRLAFPPRALNLRSIPMHLWATLRGAPRWHWRNAVIFGVILGTITGGFALFNFHDAVISQIEYFQKRPLQIEATGSTILWLAKGLGIPWQGIRYNFGSINIDSPLGAPISLLGTLCLLAGLTSVLWQQWRAKLDITQAFIALILLFIATGKVFSPQYLIWVIPLLVYAGAFDLFWLLFWGAISLLTSVHFIFWGGHLPISTAAHEITHLPRGFFEIIGMRNLFFVFVTLAYLCNWFQIRQRQPVPPPRTGKETQPLPIPA